LKKEHLVWDERLAEAKSLTYGTRGGLWERAICCSKQVRRTNESEEKKSYGPPSRHECVKTTGIERDKKRVPASCHTLCSGLKLLKRQGKMVKKKKQYYMTERKRSGTGREPLPTVAGQNQGEDKLHGKI